MLPGYLVPWPLNEALWGLGHRQVPPYSTVRSGCVVGGVGVLFAVPNAVSRGLAPSTDGAAL